MKKYFFPGFVSLLIVFSSLTLSSAQSGSNIFSQKCAACHSIGKGKLVGPDLKGVTVRREEAWLKRQIKTPEVLIAEKDPIVMQNLIESNNVPMAPLGLNDAEVDAVIAYLKSTELQLTVSTGLPSQYMPTIWISLIILFLFTVIALKAGSKKVEVR